MDEWNQKCQNREPRRGQNLWARQTLEFSDRIMVKIEKRCQITGP